MKDSMKLTVLADNRTNDPVLETEHGLCIHMDTGKIRLLLDTGASDVFIRNASALGIDLADVDFVFISHGHRDHAGGLTHLLEKNKKAKVIVSSSALNGSYHSSRKGMHDISTEWPHEMMDGRLICIDEEMEIEGMRIIPHFCCHHPIPKADSCLYERKPDGIYLPDDFRHEMALQVDDFLFTGCAHRGLMNIMEASASPVRTVMGGFHLPDAGTGEEFESDSEICSIATELLARYPETVFYTGHCTGDNVFLAMKKVLGKNLMQFCCGMTLES